MNNYELILANTLGTFEEKAKCIVDDSSDTAIRIKVFASELAKMEEKILFCINQMYPNTAVGEYLARHGEVRGIIKKTASTSTGLVVFKSKAPAATPVLIPKGTLCTSSKSSLIMFETTQETTLEKNSSNAIAPVISTVVGSNTNVAAGYIDLLVTSIPGISTIVNVQKTKGGSDDEPDDMFRERVLETYGKISNGANLSYYEQFAKTKPDIWFAKACFTPNTSNQVELFVDNRAHTLSSGIIADLQAEIDEIRALGTKIIVKKPVEKLIDVSMIIKVDNILNSSFYYDKAFQAIDDEMSLSKVGQRFSPAKLARAILKISGISDVSITAPTLPVPALYNQIIEHGAIEIIVQEEVKI